MAIKKITQTLVTKPWGRLVANSEAKIAAMSGPLRAHIDKSRAEGTDLTQKLFEEYTANQSALFDWRKSRACAEFATFRSGQVFSLAGFGIKESVKAAHFFTHIFFLFIVGVMIGRNSVFPILPTDSPFRLQLELQSVADQRQ